MAAITIYPHKRAENRIGADLSRNIMEVINIMHSLRGIASHWRDGDSKKNAAKKTRSMEKFDGVAEPMKPKLRALSDAGNPDLTGIAATIYSKVKQARRLMGKWANSWAASDL